MPRYFHGSVLSGIKRIDYDATPPAYPYRQGRTYWDALDLTLAIMQNDGVEEVINQVGQETAVWVRNDSGVDIDNGDCVYIVGSVGQRPSIALAQANSLTTSDNKGIATQTIPHNSNGFVTIKGIVRDIDTSAWNEGDILYLSDTVAGHLQNTPVTAGYNMRIGLVLFKSAGAGIIYADPDRFPAYGNIAGGNYTQWYFDGTMRSIGLGTCYRDELQSLAGSAALVTPANDILNNPSEGSLTFKTSARYPTDYVFTNHQLNHDWIPGTVIDPHLHWWQLSANIPNWLLEYRWQKQLQDKTTAWTPLVLATHAGVWTANPFNQITETAAGITPPVGYGQVSDIVQMRLYRDVTNASGMFGGADVAANIDVVNFDTHINIDMLGSAGEYTKYP